MRDSKKSSAFTGPLVFVGLLVLLVSLWMLRFPLIKGVLHQQFPQIRVLPTSELDSWLVYANRRQPLILDARNPQEYAVSHLPNARLVATTEQLRQTLAGVEKNYPIVAYCATGGRACRLAEQLQREGYTNVYVLEGSIFQWVQEGRLLLSGDERVAVVHPHSTWEGVLLDPRFKSQVRPSS